MSTSSKNLLKKLQRQALLSITPVRNGSPTSGLEVIYGISPILDYLEASSCCTALRIEGSQRDYPHMSAPSSHVNHWRLLNARDGVHYEEFDYCNTTQLVEHFTTDITGSVLPSDTDIEVFTDGSKKDEHTGYGFVIKAFGTDLCEFSEPLECGSSVYEAELMAINMAVETLAKLKFKGEKITIFSDSMSSIQALEGIKIKSTLVKETLKKVNSLARRNTVSIRWVKAHVGVEGNEQADELAKSGSEILGPSRHRIPAGITTGKQTIKSRAHEKWVRSWKNSIACCQTKHWFNIPNMKKSSELLKKDRKTVGTIVSFITGFNNLRYHEHNIGAATSNVCRLCDCDQEEAIHLVETCQALALTSIRIFGIEGTSQNWRVNALDKFLKEPAMKRLLDDS
jgi:ribonuclease HI